MTTVNVNTTLVQRPTVYGNTAGMYNVAKVIVPGVATAAGSGAGATVVTTIAFTGSNLPPSTAYTIQGFGSQAQALSFSAKTTTGFTLTQTPLSGALTLSSGTVDLVINWGNGGTNGSAD
jgi:hypothetical protein